MAERVPGAAALGPPRSVSPGMTAPAAPAARKLPSGPRERKPALAALALLLIAGGALAAAYLVVQSGHRVSAIEIVRPVGAGERIPAGAMREVRIAVGGDLGYVPWNQAGQVARYYAATAIPAGTLLSEAMVRRGSDLTAGRAVLGLALTDGQMPAGLQAGDHIDIYQVSDANQSCPGVPGSLLAPAAVVVSIRAAPATSGSPATDVEVAVDPADAGAVACNAANGSAGVAQTPRGHQPPASPAQGGGKGGHAPPPGGGSGQAGHAGSPGAGAAVGAGALRAAAVVPAEG